MVMIAVMTLASTTSKMMGQNYGIVFGELEVTSENAADIFGDGLASYSQEQNVLTLQNGFDYHLSHGLVSVNTGRDFTISLEGNATIYAAFECGDALVIESSASDTLKMTSNISGSALKCERLTINDGVCLELLSRNSQEEMYALHCVTDLVIHNASLYAEVTTAQLAVAAENLSLDGCWMQKPRGGGINASHGGICFADGVPAKVVRIIREGYGVGEIGSSTQSNVEKVFEDGQIVIIKDGKRYNVAGQEIR